MSLMRRIAAITGKGEVVVLEEAVPELKPGEALVKIHASLISPGTEMGGVKRRRENPQPDAAPRAFGYSAAGEVVKVNGPSRLEPGMRVAAMGGGYASHANYGCVPVNLLMPLPDAVSYEQACYACLAATSMQAIRRAVPQLGEFGAVLGLGIVGNCAAQLARESGARVIAWEGVPERIAMARACGIKDIINYRETDSVEATRAFADLYGLDFAVVAFGGDAQKAFDSLVTCMKVSADGHPMGRIVVVGAAKFMMNCTAAQGNIDVRRSSRTGPGYHDPVWEHGADYPDAFVQFTTQRNLREVVTLMAENRLVVTPMTTHRVPLERIGETADLLIEQPGQALGVILEMTH